MQFICFHSLGVGQFPKWISLLDKSIHQFRRQCSPSFHWILVCLHPFARWCSSCWFQLDSFLRGRIGALIGLFTHGLAIKKLLGALSHYQLNATIIRRDTVIITVCAERLKSFLNSAPNKSLCALNGGNGQIIGLFDILPILTVLPLKKSDWSFNGWLCLCL